MNDTLRMLEILNEGFPEIAQMEPLEARRQVDARVRPTENVNDAVSEDSEITVHGQRIAIRIYRPVEGAKAIGPITIYAHGGGFLHGSIDSHDSFCRTWVKGTGSTVVSVEYRLAPEWGAPAPALDVLGALEWVRAEGLATEVILAGDSSGANAVLVAALMLAERDLGDLKGLVLLYPFLDPERSLPSHQAYAEGYFITSRAIETYWRHYLTAPGSEQAQAWQINPLRADSFRQLPPSIVVTAGRDTLQDEGRAAYERMVAEGVPAIHHHFPDQFHGFMTIPGYRPAASGQQVLWSSFTNLFGREG